MGCAGRFGGVGGGYRTVGCVGWLGLGRAGLAWLGLGRAGLGWLGLGRVGLAWLGLCSMS